MPRTGRPLRFKNPQELQEKVDEYFDICEEKGEEPMITALAYHLDTSRSTLMDYENNRNTNYDKDFSYVIKKAKDRCEIDVEKRLIKRGNAGDIFIAKQYGYTDKNETHLHHSGDVKLSDLFSSNKTD